MHDEPRIDRPGVPDDWFRMTVQARDQMPDLHLEVRTIPFVPPALIVEPVATAIAEARNDCPSVTNAPLVLVLAVEAGAIVDASDSQRDESGRCFTHALAGAVVVGDGAPAAFGIDLRLAFARSDAR